MRSASCECGQASNMKLSCQRRFHYFFVKNRPFSQNTVKIQVFSHKVFSHKVF
nr:MAG TPA: hypothetical protein [Caudoviricetes sp.]